MSKTIGIDVTSLANKCKYNTKRIRKSHLQSLDQSTKYYADIKNNIGKTFNDIGYNFIPISEILKKDLDFYKQLNIIK